MFTSGLFGDLYVIDSSSYNLRDDMACFRLSKIYHRLPESCFIEENFYEVKYGKVKYTEDNQYLIYWYEKQKPFTKKLRVYKIKNM